MTDQHKTSPFGYKDIPAGEKQARVRGVFDAVADKYDAMNDLMSFGLHRLWKAHMVAALRPPTHDRPFRLIDIAGGTGDIALRAAQKAGAGFRADIIDINEEMLRVGRARAAKQQADNISFALGDAEALPLPDACADAVTIAFGIRNVTHIDKALAQAHRILKPNGRFLCLEFSHVEQPALAWAYHAWSFNIIPKLGQWFAGEAAPYQYLVESIRRFPPPEKFATMIEEAGFARVRFEMLTGGVAALHSGLKVD